MYFSEGRQQSRLTSQVGICDSKSALRVSSNYRHRVEARTLSVYVNVLQASLPVHTDFCVGYVDDSVLVLKLTGADTRGVSPKTHNNQEIRSS